MGRVFPRHGHRGRPLNSVVRCRVTNFRSVAIRAAIFASALLVASCSLRGHLDVVAGSTAERLIFRLYQTEENPRPAVVSSISVERCVLRGPLPQHPEPTGHVVWRATVYGTETGPELGEFEYGRDVGLLRTREGPEPLTEGCYFAVAWGRFPDHRDGGIRQFTVSSDGRVS